MGCMMLCLKNKKQTSLPKCMNNTGKMIQTWKLENMKYINSCRKARWRFERSIVICNGVNDSSSLRWRSLHQICPEAPSCPTSSAHTEMLCHTQSPLLPSTLSSSAISLYTPPPVENSISQKAFHPAAPIHPSSIRLSHVWSVTSLAQTPTFLSDDAALGECVRRRRRGGEGWGRERERERESKREREERRGCPARRSRQTAGNSCSIRFA